MERIMENRPLAYKESAHAAQTRRSNIVCLIFQKSCMGKRQALPIASAGATEACRAAMELNAFPSQTSNPKKKAPAFLPQIPLGLLSLRLRALKMEACATRPTAVFRRGGADFKRPVMLASISSLRPKLPACETPPAIYAQ
jgi:hypothetical protein